MTTRQSSLWRAWLPALLVLLFSTYGRCASGAATNFVATKVADLPEAHPQVTVYAVDFSPDGSRIAAQSDALKISIWDWRHGRIERTLEKPQGAGDVVFTPNPIRYSPDGRLLAACGRRAVGNVVVRLWNTGDGSIAKDIVDPAPGECGAVDFTPDSKLLVRAVDRTVRPSEVIAYEVGTWTRAWSFPSNSRPQSCAISPDGKLIAIAGELSVVPKEGPLRLLQENTLAIMALPSRGTVQVIKTKATPALAWSPDDARIVLAGEGYVEVFAPLSGQLVQEAMIDNSPQMHVGYASNGRYFVESGLNGPGTGFGVNIWDGQRRTMLQHIPGNIGDISISRDGRYLVLGSTGHTTVWELK